ncbi:bZIP transcription factor 60-like [Oryza brachyantha]|uniref:BZIP domain-containing protein n=1 Tax=Oryza brachyantha TaxID=4533 RepID=J3MNI5_ORYBR|nr:bZIP transcription factor 60-like [Oryza brachyantha]
MAETDLLAPPFGDLPFQPAPGDGFPDFPALGGDDAFAFEDFDLEDLDFDFDVDVDLLSPDAPPPPPPLATSSSSAGSPGCGASSSSCKNEESAESSSRSAVGGSDGGGGKGGKEDEARRRARLVRNRESAHLSRQRKKQYVEELEGKVKVMQATIADLTARISCVTAENAALKQQLSGVAGAGAPPPLPMYPAVYPLPPPWIHPAYAMRGSQVPLVPIPRLKTQRPASTPEPPAKKARKTKKVASVSLLGLLFLMMVGVCLFPAINRMYGGIDVGEGAVFGPSHHGRTLAVEGPQNSVSNGIDQKVTQNGSETLPALLYLPRNGKHVKINGNLVIKSIVASEKASSHLSNQGKEETSLAIPGYVAPLEAREVMDSAKGMRNELMALAPGDRSIYHEDDGMQPQWFSEAMSGPMLNSGMCTEVFQFDLSPTPAHANGIVPVYSGSMTNSSQNCTENLPSGHVPKVKNRRILYSEAIPLQGSTANETDHFKAPPKNQSQSHASRKPASSVVVSVLADPREASDRDSEGRMSSNSLSRIFVVVLIDSVKYVTYSCVLPFKSHSPHL